MEGFQVDAMRGPNHPMQEVLRREMGIDAFALDGDDTQLGDEWQDRRRAPAAVTR